MSGRYTVDTLELEQLQSQSAQLADRLSSKTVDANSLAGAAGHHWVEYEYSEFAGKWSDGLWKISHNLEELAKRIEVAAKGYSDTESSIETAAASGLGGGSGSNNGART